MALFLSVGLTGAVEAADAPEGGAWIDCPVTSVAAFRDHLTVRCGATASGLRGEVSPREFAIESTGPLTEPLLRLAVEAKGQGKPLAILFVRDPAANPPGCPVDRCRRIAGLELK
ncbi:MAG: hypothetical protein WC068_10200 [Caulobacter sp.]